MIISPACSYRNQICSTSMTEPRHAQRRTLFEVTSNEALWGEGDENEELQPGTSYLEIDYNKLTTIGKPIQFAVGSKTWIDPASGKVTCMWQGCKNPYLHSIDELENHIAIHIQLSSYSHHQHQSPFPCPIHGCTFSGRLEISLKSHLSVHIHHVQKQMEALENLKANRGSIEGCGYSPILQVDFDVDLACYWEYCDATFESVIDFFKHVSLHISLSEKGDKIDKMRHCGWRGCNKEFKNKGDLRKHANRHFLLKKCACPFCGAWMNSWEKLYLHLKRKISSEEYKCAHCHKTFADEQMLSRHLPIHIFHERCELCGIVFRLKYDLDRHMQSVHCEAKTRSFPCDFDGCDQVFENRSQLTQHRIIHRIAQFKCKHCNEKFVLQHLLAAHKNSVHKGKISKEDRYECHICNKRMDSAAKLSYHLRKNHDFQLPDGFRRFSYKLCGDGFYRVATMKITQDLIENPSLCE